MDMIRTFIAIPVPEKVRLEMSRTIDEALRGLPAARAVHASGIHGTLKFIGQFDQANVEKVGELLKLLAKQHERFRLQVSGVGGFPNLENPRVIWAGLVGETERLVKLAEGVDKITCGFGVEPEKRPFTPHLTLARIKAAKQLGLLRNRLHEIETVSFGELPVEEIVIYRSDLSQTGARYTPLFGASLRK